MPLNKPLLSTNLTKIFKRAAETAYKRTYNLNTDEIDKYVKESPTDSELANLKEKQSEIMAKEFAKEFSKIAGPDVATEIDTYIRSITLVPVLTAPTGPVAGTIQII